MKRPNTQLSQHKFSALFDIQGEIENSPEGMNYNRYAEVLWVRVGLNPNDPEFNQFKRSLVRNMKRIEMSDLVNFDQDTIKKLLTLPGRHILWSKGDSKSTRYQPTKFLQSGIGGQIESLLGKSDKSHSHFLRNQNNQGTVTFGETELGWIVAEEKITKLEEYLEAHSNIKKIIVAEDSIKNLEAVKRLGEERGIEVRPIWYTGSRAGKTLMSKDPEAFNDQYWKYNGRQNAEILYGDLIRESDEDTLFLWDLDGVLCDNIEMRERQTQAKITAIKDHTNLETDESILAALQPTP